MEGEGEVAVLAPSAGIAEVAKAPIESTTPCHSAPVVGPYRVSNPLRLTVLAAKSEDYTIAPQHHQGRMQIESMTALTHLLRNTVTDLRHYSENRAGSNFISD